MQHAHQIVTLQQAALVVEWLAVVLPIGGLAVGAVVGWRTRTGSRALLRGLAVGLMGPLIYLLWLLYHYLIRYDPQTGYCGLHHTSVLLLNVFLFALTGVALGAIYGRLFRAPAPRKETSIDGAK